MDRVALGLELPVMPGTLVPNPVVRAREFERWMAGGRSAAEAARAFGVTRRASHRTWRFCAGSRRVCWRRWKPSATPLSSGGSVCAPS